MIVVSDTSPILNLAIVDRLDLLRGLFIDIVIPPSVSKELARHGTSAPPEWMRVIAAQDRRELERLGRRLDPGEAEAIVVAVEIKASLILVDEQRGRHVATEHGLAVMGLLGVLAEAKGHGLIDDCRTVLDAMIYRAGF